MKVFQGVLLAAGICTILFAIYLAYANYKEDQSYEKADAVIIDFRGTRYVDGKTSQSAVVGFVYHGDSVSKNTGYYSAGMEIGKHYTVVFPKGDPYNFEVEQELWTLPLVLFGIAVIFLIGPAWLITLKERWKERKWGSKVGAEDNVEDAPHTKKDQAVGRMVFTVIGVGLTITAIYLFKVRLANPNGQVDWSIVVVLGIIGLALDYAVVMMWIGAMVETWGTECDADFVRVRPASLSTMRRRGQHDWIIECTWQDFASGKKYTWKSMPFNGDQLYYNRHKIRVTYFSGNPKYFALVDLAFVSKKNNNGILLVDEDVLKKALTEAEQYNKDAKIRERNKETERERSKGKELIIKIGVALAILFFVGWWSYSCDPGGGSQVEESSDK